MLPYEPLIKNVQSKIRCYERKSKKVSKSGTENTYTSTQYIISLKHDHPFSCDEEITVISSKDYFKIIETLNQRKNEYGEYLDQIISLERDLKLLKRKLSHYEELDIDVKLIKLNRLEREILDLENRYGEQKDLLESAKNELKSQEKTIEKLKSKGFMGKMSGLFSGKK